MNRKTAPWAPSEPEADCIIVEHAPRLARDLRLSVPKESETVRTGRLIASMFAEAGVRSDVAAWNIHRAFGTGIVYGPERETEEEA